MNRVNITDIKINPWLRGANHITNSRLNILERYNYGYQLCYIITGTGKAQINDSEYDLGPGKIYLYGPGDKHSFKSVPTVSVSYFHTYFSFMEVSTDKLSTGNTFSKTCDNQYWQLADPLVSIDGLPSIPFELEIPEFQRNKIELILEEMVKAFVINPAGNSILCKGKFLQLIHLLRRMADKKSNLPAIKKLDDFRNYIATHYHEEINRNTTCKKIGISTSYLTSLLRKHLSTNFSEYLNRVRLNSAKALLRNSDLKIKEIAYQCGYKDTSYFILKFRKEYKESPSKFR